MSKDDQTGFERAEGVKTDADDIRTVEWLPAYFCELAVLRSKHIDEFKQIDIVKKKKFLRKEIEEVYEYRASLEEIRTSPLKSAMQHIITEYFDFKRCLLPNVHKLPCRGKIIAEKIPRSVYTQGEPDALKYVLVKQSECCGLYRDGKLFTILDAGRHDIISQHKDWNILDLVYIDQKKQKLLWGTSSYTSDQIRVNSSGSVIATFKDPNNFLLNIFTDKNEYYEADLNDFVRDKISEIIRTEMAKLSAQEIFAERDAFIMNLQVAARKTFEIAGLSLDELAISKMDFPPEIRDQLQSLKISNLQADAEVERLIKLQQAGISATEHQRMQALKTLAETPGSGTADVMKAGIVSGEPAHTRPISPPTQGNICPSCGSPVGNAKFCPNCGSAITTQKKACNNCGADLGNAKFCPNCGSPAQ